MAIYKILIKLSSIMSICIITISIALSGDGHGNGSNPRNCPNKDLTEI